MNSILLNEVQDGILELACGRGSSTQSQVVSTLAKIDELEEERNGKEGGSIPGAMIMEETMAHHFGS